jgi:hypothetical protein
MGHLGENLMDSIDLLVAELLDKNGDAWARDDIATDAGSIADPRFIPALVAVSSDPESDSTLADTAAASLGQIWIKVGYFDKNAVKGMQENCQGEILAVFEHHRPDWHKELLEFLAQK